MQRIQSGAFDTTTLVRDIPAMLPDWAQRLLARIGIGDDLDAVRDRLIDALQQAGQLLAAQALNLGQNTLRFVARPASCCTCCSFCSATAGDRPQPRRDAADAAVQPGAARPFAAVVRATVKGNIVIAAIQGTIGGVTFALLGSRARCSGGR